MKIVPADTSGAAIRYLKCPRCGKTERVASGAGEVWGEARCDCGARMVVQRTKYKRSK